MLRDSHKLYAFYFHEAGEALRSDKKVRLSKKAKRGAPLVCSNNTHERLDSRKRIGIPPIVLLHVFQRRVQEMR